MRDSDKSLRVVDKDGMDDNAKDKALETALG